MRPSAVVPRSFRQPLAAKVPEITVLFWGIKVLTTGTGEAASDYLAKVSLVLAAGIGVIGFAVGMWLQFRSVRYRPVVYWFAVLMVAVFGTMAADALHVVLGVPYLVSTVFYAVALAVVLVLWRRTEGTLSIHSITTRRRETWYWLTVLLTFALGTAAGDLTAFVLHLGYLGSAVLFAVAIVVPALAWRAGLNPVAAFWTAYVLTRPLGASLADWLGKPSALGGLAVGDGVVTVLATLLIAVLVGYVAVTRHGVQDGDVRGNGEFAAAGRASGAPGS
ncbi:MAG TPA: hypothetical protein VGN47_16210 [Blastococcus sp.]|jgi:uncharacterized membrane-anchored protein|nr:hypothetical protein [Blastococcus sp.]